MSSFKSRLGSAFSGRYSAQDDSFKMSLGPEDLDEASPLGALPTFDKPKTVRDKVPPAV